MIVHYLQRWSHTYAAAMDNPEMAAAVDAAMKSIGAQNRPIGNARFGSMSAAIPHLRF